MPTLALLALLAADPYADFAKTFPELKVAQKIEWKGKSMPLYELEKLLGEPAGFPEDAALTRVGRLGAVPGPVAFILRVRAEQPMSTDDRLVLMTFDGKGKKVATKSIASHSGSEGGSSDDQVTVGAGGTLDVAGKFTVALQDIPQLTDLPIESHSKVRIGLDGSVALEKTEQAPDGRFDDPDSKEVLIVSGKKILYRGSETKPVQELVVNTLDRKAGTAAVAFAKAKDKLYQLAWSSGRDAIACTDPDKKTQTFKRVW